MGSDASRVGAFFSSLYHAQSHFFSRHVAHWPSLEMRKQTDAVALLFATLRRQPLALYLCRD